MIPSVQSDVVSPRVGSKNGDLGDPPGRGPEGQQGEGSQE